MPEIDDLDVDEVELPDTFVDAETFSDRLKQTWEAAGDGSAGSGAQTRDGQ